MQSACHKILISYLSLFSLLLIPYSGNTNSIFSCRMMVPRSGVVSIVLQSILVLRDFVISIAMIFRFCNTYCDTLLFCNTCCTTLIFYHTCCNNLRFCDPCCNTLRFCKFFCNTLTFSGTRCVMLILRSTCSNMSIRSNNVHLLYFNIINNLIFFH